MVRPSLLALKWWILLRDKSETIWRHVWTGRIFLLATIGCALYWYFHVPPPGYAVVAMTVAAGLMAIRAEISAHQKWVWLVCLFALAFIEIRAINHDREEHDKAQRAALNEERQHFGDIGKGIMATIEQSDKQFKATTEQNQNAFNATMSQFQGTTTRLGSITDLAQENLKEATGAGTYPEILAFNPKAVPSGRLEPDLTLAIIAIGKYNLRNVEVSVRKHVQKYDIDSILRSMTSEDGVQIPIAYANRMTWIPLHIQPLEDGDTYDIHVRTPSKNFREILVLRHNDIPNLNGGWMEDYTVTDDYGHVLKEYKAPKPTPPL